MYRPVVGLQYNTVYHWRLIDQVCHVSLISNVAAVLKLYLFAISVSPLLNCLFTLFLSFLGQFVVAVVIALLIYIMVF